MIGVWWNEVIALIRRFANVNVFIAHSTTTYTNASKHRILHQLWYVVHGEVEWWYAMCPWGRFQMTNMHCTHYAPLWTPSCRYFLPYRRHTCQTTDQSELLANLRPNHESPQQNMTERYYPCFRCRYWRTQAPALRWRMFQKRKEVRRSHWRCCWRVGLWRFL